VLLACSLPGVVRDRMGSQLSCGFQAGDHNLFVSVEFDNTLVLQESCCGSDAFYRDEIFETLEPQTPKITDKVVQQARYKTRKAKVFIEHAVSSVQTIKLRRDAKRISQDMVRVSPPHTVSVRNSLRNSVSGGRVSLNGAPCEFAQSYVEWMSQSPWVGKTIREWKEEGLQSPKEGACWKKGDGVGLPIRDGPNYLKTRATTKTASHMYNSLTVDVIKSDHIFDEVVGKLVDIPPASKGCLWTKDCPLPRVLCINVKLPYTNPKNPFASEDGGMSFVAFFEISDEVINGLKEENPPACVRLFQKFCEGPCGKPGCPTDPNKSLNLRRNGSTSKDRDTGIFKAVGWCENEDELGVPTFLRQFNGKSFVVADSGYVVKDPEGVWMELGFDVRQFPFLFRDALYSFGYFLPKAQYHVGFMVQATDDEFLPEGLLGDLYLSGANIQSHPWKVEE